jgi:hypothetical protein
MDMGMMLEGLAPGVQDGGDAGLGAKMLRIGGDGRERLGRRAHQDSIDKALFWKASAAASGGRVKTTWK